MGDVFKQQKTRNGKTILSGKWYGNVKQADGSWKRVPLSTDKQAARSMLADLHKREERKKAGIIDPASENRQLPIVESINEYFTHMKLKGDGPRHLEDTERLLYRVIKDCGFETLAKLDATRLDRFLSCLVKPDGKGCSARTKNTYRQAVIGFANWCVHHGKLDFNPLLRSTKPAGEKKTIRRALPFNQIQHLLEVARQRPVWDRETIRTGPRKGTRTAVLRPEVRERLEREGRQRALLYKVALNTGLRREEIRNLLVKHLRVQGETATVVLPPNLTKNKKEAILPVRADLYQEIKAWIGESGLSLEDRVFEVGRDVAKHLRRDLKEAGIPEVDEHGRVFDFHAFRKCFGTYLHTSGVPLVTAKELMRHSTVELTAGVYNDASQHDLGGAVESLPKF